ncbi:MerR family DNA-binding transcriptional regulator [Botrimarina mediterranea]|uniref:MerR family DNA-binding transcriptional regulator n=1 Tax=Botrimarina mediterranea TaxID=2528022 RepID=UPI0011A7F19A|nr:MerR family DNA-binding transcriptional regulator [Botrimarina mediterranea]
MTKLDEYLRISEAAEYVGVAPNTLRNWGRCGKLMERRHPINGYRLYAKKDLDRLLHEVDHPTQRQPRTRRPR